MASELHPWRFELEIFPSLLPSGHVFEPKLNAQPCVICEAFFSKCFEQSTSWCFGSHFFVARSHRFIATCCCHFLASFKKKEKHGKKTPLSTFHSNQLQHIHLACFKTDLPDSFWFNFVQVITEPCGSVVFVSGRSCDRNPGFSAADNSAAWSIVFVSFKSVLLHTSGKCQSIKRTACMLNFIYIVECKWYL